MTSLRYPETASVYEALRTNPAAGPRLQGMGLTREYYDYCLGDVARVLGVPRDRLDEIIALAAGERVARR